MFAKLGGVLLVLSLTGYSLYEGRSSGVVNARVCHRYAMAFWSIWRWWTLLVLPTVFCGAIFVIDAVPGKEMHPSRHGSAVSSQKID